LDVAVVGFAVVDEVVSPSGCWVSVGGVPTYAGLTAASLGHRALAVSNVGEDGSWVLERLGELGVDTSRVRVVGGRPTTRFKIERINGRRMWVRARCVEISPDQLELDASAAYLGPVAWEVGEECVAAAVRRMGLVAIDPQGLMREVDRDGLVRLRPFPMERLRGVGLLRLSEEECAVLGFGGLRETALRLSERLGCDVMVSSTGEGVWVCGGSARLWGRVRPERVIDTVGAGDVAGGAYLVGMLESGDRAYSLALALAAASERISLRGPQRLDGGRVRRRAEELLESVESW
jgi:sugar/nucleoside kinase (ribokinase family)